MFIARFLAAPSSVADPDPEDPNVFGPQGSGYIRCTDPDPALDPSVIKQK
jgi:hypothetical protein